MSCANEDKGVVNWPPRKEKRDETVYVFRHKEKGVLVYGQIDAENYLDELISNGYLHTATLSASIVLESIINMDSIHDVWEAVHYIDKR